MILCLGMIIEIDILEERAYGLIYTGTRARARTNVWVLLTICPSPSHLTVYGLACKMICSFLCRTW